MWSTLCLCYVLLLQCYTSVNSLNGLLGSGYCNLGILIKSEFSRLNALLHCCSPLEHCSFWYHGFVASSYIDKRKVWTYYITWPDPRNASVSQCFGWLQNLYAQQPLLTMAAQCCFLQDNPSSGLYSWKIHIYCILSSSPHPVAIWILPWHALNEFPTSLRRPWCHQGNLGWTLSTVQEPLLGYARTKIVQQIPKGSMENPLPFICYECCLFCCPFV